MPASHPACATCSGAGCRHSATARPTCCGWPRSWERCSPSGSWSNWPSGGEQHGLVGDRRRRRRRAAGSAAPAPSASPTPSSPMRCTRSSAARERRRLHERAATAPGAGRRPDVAPGRRPAGPALGAGGGAPRGPAVGPGPPATSPSTNLAPAEAASWYQRALDHARALGRPDDGAGRPPGVRSARRSTGLVIRTARATILEAGELAERCGADDVFVRAALANEHIIVRVVGPTRRCCPSSKPPSPWPTGTMPRPTRSCWRSTRCCSSTRPEPSSVSWWLGRPSTWPNSAPTPRPCPA